MTYSIKKPEGTFYCDYVVKNGNLYAIFEYLDRIAHKLVCPYNKEKVKNLKETSTHLIIII